ncbi:DUF4440 domain-containing protein [Streptomyces griseoviridis]|uniref:DUF4440 domain-containing protein n=1 Tax=Streptomyces griseoviridis TaxID=45398 RepID=UPI003442F759
MATRRAAEDRERAEGDQSQVGQVVDGGAARRRQRPGRFGQAALLFGRVAIRVLWEEVLAGRLRFEPEQPLPTLISGGLALTSTPPKDGRAQAAPARLNPPGFVPASRPLGPRPRWSVCSWLW